MRTAAVALFILVSGFFLAAAEKAPGTTPPGMERRIFDVLPSFLARSMEMSETDNDALKEGRPGGLKETLAGFGVKWPEGSSIQHVPQLGSLIVINTSENIADIEKVLGMLNVLPYQIRLEVFFVAFPTAVVAIAESGRHFTADDAMELWKQGKGRAASTLQIVTKSAAEATTKSVTEFIYPTEFTVTPILSDTNNRASICGGVCEPGGFETREVGAIVSVMPEVTPAGQMLDLTMTPQYVEEPIWESYDLMVATNAKPTTAVCRQPIFAAHSLSTSISLYCGAPVVLTGGWHLKRTPEVMYVIVKADLVGPDGRVIPGCRKNADTLAIQP